MATFQKAPIAGQMLHPEGPLATARSGMIISDVIPILQKNVEQLRDQITTLEKLSETQFAAQNSLYKQVYQNSKSPYQLRDGQ